MIDSPDALKELLPNVSRETIEKLAEFREMILAEDQNLISKNDKNFIWTRLELTGLSRGDGSVLIHAREAARSHARACHFCPLFCTRLRAGQHSQDHRQ